MKEFFKVDSRALISTTNVVTGTGSVITSNSFTIPTGRGRVKALQILVANETLATIDGIKLTAKNDGIDILQDARLLTFSNLYRFKMILPVDLPEGSTFTTSINNDQATAVDVIFNFYFVPIYLLNI